MTKEHPVMVGAVAVTATLGLCVMVVKEIVLPTHVAAITHESNISKKVMSDKIDSLERDKVALLKQNETLTKQVEDLNVKNAALSKDVFDAQYVNTFFKGSAYPVGLDKIKLGDKMEAVEGAFAGGSVQKEKRHILVDDAHSVFFRVQYGSVPESKTVNSIWFHIVKYKRFRAKLAEVPQNWIADSLTRSLGAPRMVGEDGECMFWRLEDGAFVYHQPQSQSFSVMDTTGYPPGCHPLLEKRRAK